MRNLIEYWNRANQSYPYVHPDDILFLKSYCKSSIKAPVLNELSYSSCPETKSNFFLHLSLLPVPYIGDLSKADIFILRLNPGFSKDGSEYGVEAQENVKAAILNNLRQTNLCKDYPFFYLNPDHSNHPGQDHWYKNLLKVADYKTLSQRVAVLQYFPYHSVNFKSQWYQYGAKELPSSIAIRSFLYESVMPKVIKKEALLVISQKAKWFEDFPTEMDNLIIYNYRNASVSSGSRGGRAIRKWLTNRP